MSDYPNLVYWECEYDGRHCSWFYNGILTKKEYSAIQKLDKNLDLFFGEVDKYCYASAKLSGIDFYENVDNELYNKYKYSRDSIDLIDIICYDQSDDELYNTLKDIDKSDNDEF
jgi:hypothetical protein